MIRWIWSVVGIGGALAVSAPQAASPEQPEQFAARWTVEVPAGASLARLPLPAAVLAQAQTPDLRDLRVFNASGTAVPLGLDRRGGAADTTAPQPAPVPLPALPVLAPDTPGAGQNAASGNTLALRIEESSGGRVVQLDVPGGAAGAAPAGGASGRLVGALIDTRALTAPMAAVEWEGVWPAARPFRFTLQRSSDLQHWVPLGSVAAYRSADGGVVAPARIALQREVLKDQYLRIGWDGDTAPGAVQLPAVRLIPASTAPAPARVAVALQAPVSANQGARLIEWRMPFATPLAALGMRAASPNTLVPVRVLARQQPEAPWTLLGRHVVFWLTAPDGQAQHSPPMELGSASWREWRVEADAGSAGFASPPALTAWLAPVQAVFVASGDGPFTLALGQAKASATQLPLASLIPGYGPGKVEELPLALWRGGAGLAAAAASADAAVPLVVATAAPSAGGLRHGALWAVLIGGVLLLAGMAWVLFRQLGGTAPAAADPEDSKPN